MVEFWRNHFQRLGIFVSLLTLVGGCSVPNGGVNFAEKGVSTLASEARGSREVSALTPTPTRTSATTPTISTTTPTSSFVLSTVYFTPSITPEKKTRTATPRLEPVFCNPLAGHILADLQEILTNPFDPPPPGKDTGHHGVDFAYYRRGDRLSILGVPVNAVMAGRVVTASHNRIPYGNMVIIETPYAELPTGLVAALDIPNGRSLYLLYAHMNETPLVKLDEQVMCGQALGEVGNTPKGWSSNPHLHFEGRSGPPGATFQGMVFYDTAATVEEMENYRLWRMSGEFVLFDPMILLSYGLADKVD